MRGDYCAPCGACNGVSTLLGQDTAVIIPLGHPMATPLMYRHTMVITILLMQLVTVTIPSGRQATISCLSEVHWAVAILLEQLTASDSPSEYPRIIRIPLGAQHDRCHPFRASQDRRQPSEMLINYCAPFGSMLQLLASLRGKTLLLPSLWYVCQLPPHVGTRHGRCYSSGVSCGHYHPSRTLGRYYTPFGGMLQLLLFFRSNLRPFTALEDVQQSLGSLVGYTAAIAILPGQYTSGDTPPGFSGPT